jgi:membrane protease YdiL (CAAX protease family)
VALRLRQKLTKGKALIVALLISQATFAVIHLPNRIYQHTPFTDFLIELPFLFLWGTMFAIVFYRTGSLFAAVGAHALMNAPTYLFDAGGLGTPIYLVGVVLLIILAPKLGLKRAKVADEPASPDAEAAVGS